MRIFFDRVLTGLSSDFIWSDGQIVLNDGDSCDWIFSNSKKRHRSVRAASEAAGCNLDLVPDVIQAGFWKKHQEHPAWHRIITKKQLEAYLTNQVGTVIGFLEDTSKAYYLTCFQAQQALIDSLVPGRVRDSSLSEHGFVPNSDGFVEIPCYDNISSATGRMSITSGPKILNMQKDLRSKLSSRWDDGTLVEIDFNALEARVLNWIVGNSFCTGDMYEWIGSQAGTGNTPRSVIKEATLAATYGMSRKNFALRYQDMPDALDAYDSVRKILRVESLDRKLRSGEKLSNFFGRPLPDTTAPISYHVQSSAVDVACHGFLWLLNQVDSTQALPVYLIHDAMVLDVKRKYLTQLEEICKSGLRIDIMDCNLPVRTRIFNDERK